ncbi:MULTISPECIES: glycosyltransferase [unclassified Pseudodesulfovibrio]|uniref:glycosyltransferase family protein n=1 Tax=unclassified Pseudodesulfovibrio TaxID=2661612 RepID=UPI000FEB70AF|nr:MULTISPECIES: glycosyltransferase [unclassified Pseudodesulfovibrio]MCJ2165000.1 glycosyltransferase [Pseudodesulfovibrio sp. S3-i]
MTGISNAIVLGVHSFATPHYKTGIQFIAEGLARRGVSVDYVSVPSSPFDVFGKERRRRMGRVWGRMGRSPVLHPEKRLYEFAFPALFPVHRLFVPGSFMLGAVSGSASGWFASRRYDLCVHDVGPTMVYMPLVQAQRHILRLNDAPRGMDDLPGSLVRDLEHRLGQGFYDRVWAVSEPLAAHAQRLAPDTPVDCIPNGFDAELFGCPADRTGRKPGTRAVYLGNRTAWLDVQLLRQAAALLPDWEFNCVGAGFAGESDRDNLRFLPPVSHTEVPELLAGYDVGLLPYRDDAAHMACVRRPLKFYEYVAAGLGVACADVGGLRKGLEGWALFGTTPEEFAGAVVGSEQAIRAVPPERRAAFLKDNAWNVRLDQMFGTLNMVRAEG